MPIRCKLGFMVNTAMGMVRRSVRKRNSTVGTLDAAKPWDPQLWGSWDMLGRLAVVASPLLSMALCCESYGGWKKSCTN